ncbi:phosphoglycerate transporter protein PgtP [Pedobacter insulae]|uniref:MFS transporter, OPA family, glycerol-3-phosphate transporter n=1 Tax=Pedobacter insulae TaxID=414048 RepID=A0A1I2XDQ4_9SPHI|nr:phosphoglycerate transporter protein PgtP [Pedobacter insulae]SFH11664.1 MFS transporter, OPA family, glycerol-3-phosphate transporter [Pedobacter insulae]
MSFNIFPPPAAHKPLLPPDRIKSIYSKERIKVFIGIFLGYAAYYLVRKNFSFAVPELQKLGFSKAELGLAASALSIAYGFSKFLMGNISDRSNARYFLSIGLVLSSFTMIFMGLIPFATSSIAVMFVLLFINGWFQGMGWPACGRVVAHWYSVRERGTAMSIWNLAHNLGGFFVGPLTVLGFELFAGFQGMLYFPGMVAIFFALVAFVLVRDTPQSVGLPPIEVYNEDYPKSYNAKTQEQEFSAKEIFLTYVLNNRLLWYIAVANAFVYLVRNGIINWAPTFLQEAKYYTKAEAAWASGGYELAAVPGTLLCGIISDKVFKGRRAPVTIIYMAMTLIAVLVYWKSPTSSHLVQNLSLWAIGFFIYGPVMLIGVQAIDLVPKKAAGTAAGLTGLFGYFIGDLLANAALGGLVDRQGWDASFIAIAISCLFAIFFTAFTWNREKENLSNLTPLSH